MMKDELQMVESSKSPLSMGAVTFLAFVTVGFIPLFAYVWEWLSPGTFQHPFWISCGLTSLAFALIGYLKATVTQVTLWKAVLETLFLGASAAALAYYVGDVLEKWLMA
jgi:VIT1/CCC1 family predicted Fe2+/Mn2+ transporter